MGDATTQPTIPDAAERHDEPTRLVNLTNFLATGRRSWDQVRTELRRSGYYTAKDESARKMFERDKRALRTLGFNIDEADDLYTIREPDRGTPPSIGGAELAAVTIAVEALAPLVDDDVRHDLHSALAKLGTTRALDNPLWHTTPQISRTLLLVHDSQQTCQPLGIKYTNAAGNQSERVIHPWALHSSEGTWYTRALDEHSGEARTFRVDRIDPDHMQLTTQKWKPPPTADAAVAALRAAPWEWGDGEELRARVRLGHGFTMAALPGSADIDLDCEPIEADLVVRDPAPFASWFLRLGTTIELLGTTVLRRHICDRLDSTIDQLAAPAPPAPEIDTPRAGPATPGQKGQGVRRAERLLRLLGLTNQGANDYATLTQTLGVTEDELADDLAQLFYYCGLPPLVGGQMVDVALGSTDVTVALPEHITIFEQLTGRELAALSIALRLVTAEAGIDSDLRARIDATLDALGAAGSIVDIARPDAATEPRLVAGLARAIREQRSIELTHRNPSTGEAKDHIVDPWRLEIAKGRTYLVGFDHGADAERLFRVDRIEAVHVGDEAFELRHTQSQTLVGGFIRGPGDTEVVVAIPFEYKAWAQGRYGDDAVAETQGNAYLCLPTGDLDRLAPLLLSLAPRCEVVAPPAAREKVRDLAASMRRSLACD